MSVLQGSTAELCGASAGPGWHGGVGNLLCASCWQDGIPPSEGQAVLPLVEIVVKCFVLKQAEFPG